MASTKRAIQRYRKTLSSTGSRLISGKGKRSYPVDRTGRKARATPKRKRR